MTTIEPEKNDVLLMNIRESGMKSQTCLFEEYLTMLRTVYSNQLPGDLYGDGIQCSFLEAAKGGGWKKGKIRCRLEIIPDESPAKDQESLDTIRNQLKQSP